MKSMDVTGAHLKSTKQKGGYTTNTISNDLIDSDNHHQLKRHLQNTAMGIRHPSGKADQKSKKGDGIHQKQKTDISSTITYGSESTRF